MIERNPSVAARVLDVIAHASSWINTSEIYEQIEEAENITIVSVSCRDHVDAGRVERRQIAGRWCYRPLQRSLFEPVPTPADELDRTLSMPLTEPTHKPPHRSARTATAGVSMQLKLRTLDRLAEIVAEDIAAVLRAIRSDIEPTT